MIWQKEVDELRRRRERALELGGSANVERHHNAGKLTIRERIAQLVDPGSFHEVGQLTGTTVSEKGKPDRFVPSPYVMGLAKIDGRSVAVGGRISPFGEALALGSIGAKADRAVLLKTWRMSTVFRSSI